MSTSRINFLLPLLFTIVFVAGLLLSISVFYGGGDDRDEDESATLFPDFSSKRLLDNTDISTADLQFPTVINLWASWCTACRYEHPIFVDLQSQGVTIYGINHRDQPLDAKRWLAEHGNPFKDIILDRSGKLGEALDVYGLPETLLVNENRTIIVHHRGTLTYEDWRNKFLPHFIPGFMTIEQGNN